MQHATQKSPIKRLLSIPDELDKAISDFRRAQYIQSQSEATRRLIMLGLAGIAAAVQPSPAHPPSQPSAANYNPEGVKL